MIYYHNIGKFLGDNQNMCAVRRKVNDYLLLFYIIFQAWCIILLNMNFQNLNILFASFGFSNCDVQIW